MDKALPGNEELAPSRIDEEDIRLTTGFADIFTAILLVVGGMLLAAFSVVGGIAIVGAAFLLGRPLVQRRGFAACGIVLALGAAQGAGLVFALVHWTIALIAAAIASAFLWRVHRIPSALALVWICLTGLVIGMGGSGFDFEDFSLGGASVATGYSLFGGVVLFAGGLWYDSQDRLRKGRLSDVAFWLHLISAPLFVHGLFAALGMNPFTDTGINPLLVFGIFLVLTAVSLAIDRRPLLASSFVYLVTATGSLLRDGWQSGEVADGADRFLNAAMAPAVIGVLLLGLAAGWTPMRSLILRPLPERLTRHLPPAAHTTAPAPEGTPDLPEAEKEPVRLVLGFNDFFVALGAMALFVGSIFIGIQLLMGATGDWDDDTFKRLLVSGPIWFPILVPAAMMWMVAEYFVRVRRMAWPAISAAFAFSLMGCAAGILLAMKFAVARQPQLFAPAKFPGTGETLTVVATGQCVLIACAIPLLANLLFWWRHRVPVSFALAIASLVPLVFFDLIVETLSETGDGFESASWAPRLLAAGLAVFGLAMWWDRQDVARKTQRADTAFWLHLLAAGLAIPAAYALTRDFEGAAALVLVAAGFLGLVALAVAIDRRAPLAVALPFALADLSEPIAGLALVLVLLAMVLRWDQARGMLLRWVSGLTGAAPLPPEA